MNETERTLSAADEMEASRAIAKAGKKESASRGESISGSINVHRWVPDRRFTAIALDSDHSTKKENGSR